VLRNYEGTLTANQIVERMNDGILARKISRNFQVPSARTIAQILNGWKGIEKMGRTRKDNEMNSYVQTYALIDIDEAIQYIERGY
jgi:hypothetical protein